MAGAVGAGGGGVTPPAGQGSPLSSFIVNNMGALGLGEAWGSQSPTERQQSASYIESHPGDFEVIGGHLVPTSYPGEGLPVSSLLQGLGGAQGGSQGPGQGGSSGGGGGSAPGGDEGSRNALANYISNNRGQLGLGDAWAGQSPTERFQSGRYIADHPGEFSVQDGRVAQGAGGRPLNSLPFSGTQNAGFGEGPVKPPWGDANPNQRYDPWWQTPPQDPIGYAPGFQRSPWGTPYPEGLGGHVPPGVDLNPATAGNVSNSTSTTTTGGGSPWAPIAAALASPVGLLALQQLLGKDTLTKQGLGALWNWGKDLFGGNESTQGPDVIGLPNDTGVEPNPWEGIALDMGPTDFPYEWLDQEDPLGTITAWNGIPLDYGAQDLPYDFEYWG